MSPDAETMDPDLAITICFGLVVLLFALGFAFYGVHEIHRSHAESATVPEPRNPRQGIR